MERETRASTGSGGGGSGTGSEECALGKGNRSWSVALLFPPAFFSPPQTHLCLLSPRAGRQVGQDILKLRANYCVCRCPVLERERIYGFHSLFYGTSDYPPHQVTQHCSKKLEGSFAKGGKNLHVRATVVVRGLQAPRIPLRIILTEEGKDGQ